MSFSLITLFDSFIRFANKFYNKIELFAAKRKGFLWALVVLACFGIILFLNVLTPMIGDDLAYLYIFGTKEPVGGIGDIIDSQVNHYKWWGGRSVVHVIAQALLQLPNLLADVLNALVYIGFAFLIYFHIKGRGTKHSLSLFVLINLAIWFLIPMFGDTILWLTGSANYLWGTSIILLFLLPYRLYEGKKWSTQKHILMSILLFVFGIVAGWTNENTVAGMIVMILLLLLYFHAQKWNIPPAFFIGIVGILIGYAIMILAPGNLFRARHTPDTTIMLVLYRAFLYTKYLFVNYGVLIILYLVSFILLEKNTSNKSSIKLSFIYIIGALAAIYAMIFSPQFPPRAWFGVVSYLLIALGMILYHLDWNNESLKKVRFSLILISFVAFLFSSFDATRDIYRAQQVSKERLELAKAAVVVGDEVCYFERFVPNTTYVHGEDEETHMLLSYYYGIFIEYKDKD